MSINKSEAFIYVRDSNTNTEKALQGAREQLSELREFAHKKGIPIVGEFIDHEQASASDRPIFQEMLGRIRYGEASVIVARSPDRLSRNTTDSMSILWLYNIDKIVDLKFSQFPFAGKTKALQLAIALGVLCIDNISKPTRQ